MEESNGFFLMHRKILHSVVFDDPITLKVWIWCLSKVSYKERDFILGGQVVHVKKGQFVTGRESASKELKIGEQVYRNRISLLKKLGKITVKSTSRFSKITVVNWEYYQQSFRNTTSRQPADNQPTTTNNKENKENKLLGETSSPKNNKKDMFNKYGEDYEEGVVDMDSGELYDPAQEAKKERSKYKDRMNELTDWLIAYQGRDKLRTNRPKQFKALRQLIDMKVSGAEAQQIIMEQMQSDYWKGKKEKPDFSTVVAIIQKRGE